MNSRRIEDRWLRIQKRTKTVRNADGTLNRIELPSWYGRRKVNGRWKWLKLFTDQRASQQRWSEIVRDHELREAGVITPQMDCLQKPLSEHVAEYLDSLKRTVTSDHYRIVSYMLRHFVSLAGWQTLGDVNPQSASRVLSALQSQGKTVAYTNQYLARLKAFFNWCIPERLVTNPLAKLKRGNVKKAIKRRARRPLAEHELARLLNTCPPSRRLKYAFPAFTGLRRRELEDLRWGDLHLDSVIPFIQLRPEQTKTGEATALPLHPYLVQSLRTLMPGMPQAKLFPCLPEGRTMLRDLTIAGVTQTDASGRRADFHGLRHTFAKRLDATGCSHATRRALMRHGSGDQTDEYTLARLSEMYEAVKRLPTPDAQTLQTPAIQIVGGTVQNSGNGQVDMRWTRGGHGPASTGSHPTTVKMPLKVKNRPENPIVFTHRQASAASDLLRHKNRDSVLEIGPRSSVG
ncbi:MAG: tyrosine-type recombinase/integrase [Tepidisphaeraceae bacterium]|jgi:integrase